MVPCSLVGGYHHSGEHILSFCLQGVFRKCGGSQPISPEIFYSLPDYVVSHRDPEAIQRIFICMKTNLVEPIFILAKEQTSFCESRGFIAVVSKTITAFVIKQIYFKSTSSVIHFNGNLTLLSKSCKLVLHCTFY
jgi:hypothetical protein